MHINIKNLSMLLQVIIGIFLCVLIANCASSSGASNSQNAKAQITLSASSNILEIGESINITVTVTPSAGETGNIYVDLSVLGQQTSGLTLSQTNLVFDSSQGSSQIVQLIAAANATPTNPSNPVQILETSDEGLNNNFIAIQVLNSNTIAFANNQLIENIRESAAVNLIFLESNTLPISPVNVQLQTNSTHITLNTNTCSFSATNTICNVIIFNDGVTGNYQVEASANGYTIAPLNVLVTESSTQIVFSPNNITMLTNNQYTATLTLFGNSQNDINVNLQTSNVNIVLNTTSCVLNNVNRSCNILIKSNSMTGSYQVIATANLYNINPIYVSVVSPNTIVFNTNTLNMLTSSFTQVELSLIGANNVQSSINVSLTTTNSNISIQPTSCSLSQQNTNCIITINTSLAVGQYQIIAQANNYNIKPLLINVNPAGAISFVQTNVNMLTNSLYQVSLILTGASTTTAPIIVSLQTSNSNVGVSVTSCTLSALQNTCNITLTSNQIAGNVEIFASAIGYAIGGVNVNVLARGSIVFSNTSIVMNTNARQSVTLELLSESSVIYPITVALNTSSVNLTLTSQQCILSNIQSSCTFTAISKNIAGQFQVQAVATNYSITPAIVSVFSPSAISFIPPNKSIATNSTTQIKLQAIDASSLVVPVTVNLVVPIPNITISPSKCTLSTTSPSCPITIYSSSTTGNFQVMAVTSSSVDITTFYLSVYAPGSIVFNPTQLKETVGQNVQGTLVLIGATSNLPPVSFSLLSSSSNFQIITPSNNTCVLSYTSPSCAITGLSNIPGVYTVTASSSDYDSRVLTIQTVAANNMSFNVSNVAMYTGSTQQIILSITDPDPNILPVSVGIISNNSSIVSISPSTCNFSLQNTSCTITLNSTSNIGQAAISVQASLYNVAPVSVNNSVPNLTLNYVNYVYPGGNYYFVINSSGGTSSALVNIPSSTTTTCNFNPSQETCIVPFSISSPQIATVTIAGKIITSLINISGTDNNPIILVNGSGITQSFLVHAGANITGGYTIPLQDGQACWMQAGWGFTQSGYFYIQTTDSAASYNAISLTVNGITLFSSDNNNPDGFNSTWGRFWQGTPTLFYTTCNFTNISLNWAQANDGSNASGKRFCLNNPASQIGTSTQYPYIIGVGMLNPQNLSNNTQTVDTYYNAYLNGSLSNCGIRITQ